MTLVEAVIVGVTFLVVLVATRELGKRDLEAIKAVRRKRAPVEVNHETRSCLVVAARGCHAAARPATRSATRSAATTTACAGSATRSPPSTSRRSERSQFVDEADERAKDLKITDYEIVKVEQKADRDAKVQVKVSWYTRLGGQAARDPGHADLGAPRQDLAGRRRGPARGARRCPGSEKPRRSLTE